MVEAIQQLHLLDARSDTGEAHGAWLATTLSTIPPAAFWYEVALPIQGAADPIPFAQVAINNAAYGLLYGATSGSHGLDVLSVTCTQFVCFVCVHVYRAIRLTNP